MSAATAWVAQAEREFFRTVNAFVEPLVMAGAGAPAFWPTGVIMLETVGARSGRPTRVPVLATMIERWAFVGTLRGTRSRWMRNLHAQPDVRYWLGGRAHRGRALVFAPGSVCASSAPPGRWCWCCSGLGSPASDTLPSVVRIVADSLRLPATMFGFAFAVIGPASMP